MRHVVFIALLAVASAESQPALRLTPDTLDFGAVPVGAEVGGEFLLIESVGDEPILIKIHTALQPFAMPFDQRYVLNEVREGLIDSRPAVLRLAPLRTGPAASDVAVDTEVQGAYVVQARAEGVEPVAFTLARGETARRALEIRNPGYARLGLRVEPPAPWLRLSPLGLLLDPAEAAALTLDVDASGLAPGVYRDTLRANQSGTARSYSWRVPVTLTVSGATGGEPTPVAARPVLTVSPTPSRGLVQIVHTAPEATALSVFDARGREVARLDARPGTPVAWTPPRPGLYLVRLITEAGTLTRSVVAVR